MSTDCPVLHQDLHDPETLQFDFRIQCISQSVAEEVEGQNDETDESCRENNPVGVGGNTVQGLGGQGTKACHGGRYADS